MKKILIYGTGMVADYFIDNHDFAGEELVGVIETVKSREAFRGFKVVEVEKIPVNIDKIYVTNSYVETINNLLKAGISKDKIILCNKKLNRDYLCLTKGNADISYDSVFAEKFNEYFDRSPKGAKYVVTEVMNMDIDIFGCDNAQNLFGQKYIVTDDYCRFGTLRLIIEEIKNNNVPGNLAELGVYRGDFSKCMNQMFPDKKLYLFDTFDVFDNNDMNVEIDNGFTTQEWFDSWNNFKNTYIDLVLEKMKYRDQCIVRKGYFPDTIPEEEMTFALVSLDCDLYEPILAGLRYFYPRLNEGGYIMLHDYNQSDHLKGVKKAVDEYEKEVGHRIIKIPIPDVCGTLVISK